MNEHTIISQQLQFKNTLNLITTEVKSGLRVVPELGGGGAEKNS